VYGLVPSDPGRLLGSNQGTNAASRRDEKEQLYMANSIAPSSLRSVGRWMNYDDVALPSIDRAAGRPAGRVWIATYGGDPARSVWQAAFRTKLASTRSRRGRSESEVDPSTSSRSHTI
jgi:hypothetical protein